MPTRPLVLPPISRKTRNTAQVNFRISPALYDRFEKKATRHGRTAASVLRFLVATWTAAPDEVYGQSGEGR